MSLADVLDPLQQPLVTILDTPVTDHEGVAFEDDGLRDGEELRPWMTDRFRAELTRTGRRFIELTGTHQERLDTAVAAVETLLAAGWNFAAPLPGHR